MNNPYRSPETFPAETAPSPSLGFVFVGIVLSAFPAVVSSLVVGHFRDALAAFGADLPALTKLLFAYHSWLWLVPAAVAAIAFRGPPLRRARGALILGVISLFVLVPACVIALYLPIFKLGAVVG
ncbi:hypothetical protein [Lysobacter claricitrinus]|uniref:hypothetical protein n=1 Tax=Lysobacter claricitrinus TaxID=3367728 RepID=UPI0037DB01FB